MYIQKRQKFAGLSVHGLLDLWLKVTVFFCTISLKAAVLQGLKRGRALVKKKKKKRKKKKNCVL
jgi:hypothetical protein